MSKNNNNKKSKNSIDLKKIIEQLKKNLDPKELANKTRFKNENAKRLIELYTIIVSISIIIIVLCTNVLPVYKSYPFNFLTAEKIKEEINDAQNKAQLIELTTKKSVEYKEVIEQEALKIPDIERYLPAKHDAFSFVMYVENLADKNNVEITNVVLPQIEDVNTEEKNNEQPTGENQGTVDNGTSFGQNISNNQPQQTTDNGQAQPQPEVEEEDIGYSIDIKVNGMFTNLTNFFSDLENTKEIIVVSDVKIEEYIEEQLDEYGNPISANVSSNATYVPNFDMKKVKQQVSFKITLYSLPDYEQYQKKITESQFAENNTNGETFNPNNTDASNPNIINNQPSNQNTGGINQ